MRLMQFLSGLSKRERLLLGFMVILVLPLALLQGVALPLLARQDAAHTAVAEAEALRSWISERQAELALLPAPANAETDTPARPPAGLSALEAGLIDAGLRQSVVTLANPSGASVALRFEAVPFAQLMPWLDGLERQMGYQLTNLRLTRTDTPGLTDAEIQLEPLP